MLKQKLTGMVKEKAARTLPFNSGGASGIWKNGLEFRQARGMA
jgi:hypothetical protein